MPTETQTRAEELTPTQAKALSAERFTGIAQGDHFKAKKRSVVPNHEQETELDTVKKAGLTQK